MQTKIGNSEILLVRWIRDHEQPIVYGVWGLFAAGLVISFLLARDEIFRQLK